MFNAKHIVITGGSSGLGLELAQRLAAEGARLTLIARDGQKLAEAAASIRRNLPTAQVNIQAVDVCDEQATQAAMQQIAGQHAGIDMLINSAGILREGRFEKMPLKDFRDIMEINYFGLINSARAALPEKGLTIAVGSASTKRVSQPSHSTTWRIPSRPKSSAPEARNTPTAQSIATRYGSRFLATSKPSLAPSTNAS